MSGDSKGKKLLFDLIPSLEHLALVKIATLLVKEGDADSFVKHKVSGPQQFPLYGNDTRLFESIEYQNKVYVESLSLPKKLKDKICNLCRSVETQVVYWKKCPENYCTESFLHYFRHVSWTSQGTIDKRKTYESVVKTQALDVKYQYELACIVCLEDSITILWDQMLETERNEIVLKSEKASMFKYINLIGWYDARPITTLNRYGGLFYFWSCVMKGEEFRLKDMTENYPSYTPHQYMLKYAAVQGNKAAVKYFCKKLTSEENRDFLLEIAKQVCSLCYHGMKYVFPFCYYVDILFFLLSQIDKEQHRHVIKINYAVLSYFLEWPWQRFFWDAVDSVFADIDGEMFDYLLRVLLRKIWLCYDDYNYQEFLGELCRRSLPEHKKYIISFGWLPGFVLGELLRRGDEQNIKLILKGATTEDKSKLKFDHSSAYCICPRIVVHYDNWFSEYDYFKDETDFYRDLVCEYISNEDELEKFKDGIRNHILRMWGRPLGRLEKLEVFLKGFHKKVKREL